MTISGTADFDFKFTAPIIGTDTQSQGSGEVTLGIDLELKILFIKKKWTLYKSDEMNLFSYGTQGIGDMLEDFQENYLYDAIEAEDLETVSRDYLKNRSEWQPYDMSAKKVDAGDEQILEEGVYPYPDAKLLDLGDNKVLAVFLDDPGTEAGYDAANNAVTMYSYSTDGGTTWSESQIIDDDKTEDESPYVYKVTDDKALVVWSDASDKLSNVDEGKTLQENLGKMDITGAWFDCKTGKMGEPVTVARTSTEEDSGDIRTDYADTAPMISYDEDTKRLMVYYTATDYVEGENPKSSAAGTDIDDATQKQDVVTYGDIINGYSVTAFTTATMDANGEFSAFDGPGFVNLAVPPINKGEEIVDPKVVDGDVISYNGLALHAYTIDKDQNDQTLGDRELFMQIYNYSEKDPEGNEGVFHYPIQITNDSIEDGNPQFARARNMTYLYWISDGDVKYINITSLVKELQANDIESEADNDSHDGFLQYCEKKVADDPKTKEDESTTLGLYYIKGDPTYIAVAHKVETDENGKVVGEQPITDFDIESNGKTMYMLWTDIVTEAKDPNETGAENVIKETQVFGAYCEPNMELKTDTKEIPYTFENNDSITYNFVDGKGNDTYPVSYTIKKQLEETDETTPKVGETVTIDYGKEPDLNGETGKVKAGDPAIRKCTVQTIVTDGGCGWSDPIQITRESGNEYNYDDLSFRVTNDNTVQAIFSRGPQTLNADGAFEVDEANRKLAVQNFVITSTLEKGEMTYRRVSDEADAETDTTAAGEAQTKETGNSTASDTDEKEGEGYCYPGDTVEYSVSLTNDGFKPLEDIQYRTYVTKDGKEVSDEVSKEWKEVAPDVYQTSKLSLDAYTDESEKAEDPLTNVEEKTVNRLLGGKTVTLSGRTTLGEDIEGTGFVIELKYEKDGKEEIEKIERDLLVEPNVTVTAGQTELIDKDTANVKVTVANSGNKEYTGDIRLKDGDTKLSEEKDVTVAPGETSSYVMEVDISKCKFGKLQDNADGSKQDSLKLDVVYGSGDDKVENVAEIVRSTSVEGGQAVDAIKSIDIGVKTSSNETEPSKISGSYYNIGQNQVISLESMFTVDENSEGAKALAKDGNSAEAQMITEWKSSDPDVAFISDKGAVVPMSEGTTEITAIVYPGQKDQVGVAAVTGDSEASDSQGNESAGRGGYMTSSGKYKVPEDLITKKTITLTVGNPTSSEPVVAPTDDPGKDEPEDQDKDEPTATPGTDEPTATPGADEPSDNPSDDDKEPSGDSNNNSGSSSNTVKVGTTKVVEKVEYEVQPGKTSVAVSDVKKNATEVVIPATVKIKGKTYPVTKIKASAFKNNKKLKTIVIGKNIKKIGKKAFYNDGQAVKIVFKGKKPPKIGKKAFAKISKYAVFKVPKDQEEEKIRPGRFVYRQ